MRYIVMGRKATFSLVAFLCCLKMETFVESKENSLDLTKTDGSDFNSNINFNPSVKENTLTLSGKENEDEQFKNEDSLYLNRVGWPSLTPRNKDGRNAGKVPYLGNSPHRGSSDELESFLTSNAEHQDQEDSSSRKSNLNIWLTLLIAAVAAAIFS